MNEVKSLSGSKWLLLGHKFVFFDKLKVEHIVDKTDEKVDLADNDKDDASGTL